MESPTDTAQLGAGQTPPGADAGDDPPAPDTEPAFEDSPDDIAAHEAAERERQAAEAAADEPADGIPERKDSEDVEDVIEPRLDPIPRTLGPDEKDRTMTYVQTELTWFTRLELFGLFGRAIDQAMSGDNPLSIDDMMQATKPQSLIEQVVGQMPGADTAPDAEDRKPEGMAQAGQILAVFARLASIAPDMLKESYCIILNVPKGHRKWAHDHGLDKLDPSIGEDILHVFIDQNWEAIEDFFGRVLPRLLKRGQKARERLSSAP